MLKQSFFFSLLALSLTLSYATSTQDRSLPYLSQMLGSLDYIHSIQCDVTSTVLDMGKRTTQNYVLFADRNYAKARFSSPKGVVFVKNKKGLFKVIKGDVQKQPKGRSFPVDLPHLFLTNLNLGEITDNYKFLISSENSNTVVVNIIPIDAATISKGKDQTTMLRLTIFKDTKLLQRVDIYKNNQFISNDYLRFDYSTIENRVLAKKGLFKNTYTTENITALVHTYSYSKAGKDSRGNPKIYIKETAYSNIILNEKLDEGLFDED